MKLSLEKLKNYKRPDAPLVCLTAYTYPMAELLSPHVDLILVGDSLGMVLYGMEDTTGVDVSHMVAHGQAVMKGAEARCLVVVDMPYGSYEESDEHALEQARHIMKETGCDAVKLEGGVFMASRIKTLTENDIPVIAHIGLLPQSAPEEGGFKIKGKNEEQIDALKQDAVAVQEAGASAVVIEGTIEQVAEELTNLITIPTIGIGASPACDGQILVTEDMLGLSYGRIPKFVKQYAELSEPIEQAVKAYAADVREGIFPDSKYTYH